MKYPTGEDILDAYWRTLLTDLRSDKKRIGPEDILRYREAFLVWSGRRHAGNGAGNSDNVLGPDFDFEHLLDFVFGWTTATTEKGYLALVPLFSKPGDAICVVPSLSVPLVLRPQPSASETMYVLVGPPYVHGIMDGEIMQKLEKGEVIQVEVKLG
jgi:hypothetical protein